MTNAEFKEWLKRHKLKQREAAEFLGLKPRQIRNYLNGTTLIPHLVARACRDKARELELAS